jgi:signal transduction histidine kinase
MNRDPENSGVDPDRRSSERPAASGHRVATEPAYEDALLDQLLELSHSLPIDQGVAVVARQAVEQLAWLFPGCAVGACVADPEGAPLIEYRLPTGADPDLGRDPTRLFPLFTEEWIHQLDESGSTFHIASPGGDHGPETAMAERAGRVLAAGLRRARTYQHAHLGKHDLQRLQAQVIQAEKLASLGQIVAGVVHELNNPLTSIVAYSDYLRKKAQRQKSDGHDTADTIERLRRISEAAERILKFSRDLVAYARPTADVPGPVPIGEVIEKALIFCEHEFAENRVTIRQELPENLPLVRGIAGQLTQVFVNLFTNAAHAMNGGGGELRIRLAPSGEWLQVDIADDGCGIDAADLEQIFEPFYTTKTDGRGTGLGLSIVRDIVKAHGGVLLAKSAPGTGSVFSLTLPLAALPPSMMPPP